MGGPYTTARERFWIILDPGSIYYRLKMFGAYMLSQDSQKEDLILSNGCARLLQDDCDDDLCFV